VGGGYGEGGVGFANMRNWRVIFGAHYACKTGVKIRRVIGG